MPSRIHAFGEPWTFHHWLGAAAVIVIFLVLGLNIWPGWGFIRALLG